MTKERAWQLRHWYEGRCPRCGGIREGFIECLRCRLKRQAINARYNAKRRSRVESV